MMHMDITAGLPNVPTENLNMHPAQREFMNSTEKESEEETTRSYTAFCFEVIRQVQKDFVWVAATMLAWQYLTGGISVVLIAK